MLRPAHTKCICPGPRMLFVPNKMSFVLYKMSIVLHRNEIDYKVKSLHAERRGIFIIELVILSLFQNNFATKITICKQCLFSKGQNILPGTILLPKQMDEA